MPESNAAVPNVEEDVEMQNHMDGIARDRARKNQQINQLREELADKERLLQERQSGGRRKLNYIHARHIN